jgi:hypothetical protein
MLPGVLPFWDMVVDIIECTEEVLFVLLGEL